MNQQSNRELLRAIKAARKEMAAELATATEGTFTSWKLQSTLRAVDDILDKLKARTDDAILKEIAVSWSNGQTSALKKLGGDIGVFVGRKASELEAFIPSVTPTRIRSLKEMRPDLIRDTGFDPAVTSEMMTAMKARIRRELQVGILKGDSYADLAKRIVSNEGVLGMTKRRAFVIARTEGHRATQIAQQQTMEAVQEKFAGQFTVWQRWVSSGDSRSRTGHIEAGEPNQKPVKLNEPFMVREEVPGSERYRGLGKEPLRYPGDPDGRPSNTINCRCTTIERAFPAKASVATVAKNFMPA